MRYQATLLVRLDDMQPPRTIATYSCRVEIPDHLLDGEETAAELATIALEQQPDMKTWNRR